MSLQMMRQALRRSRLNLSSQHLSRGLQQQCQANRRKRLILPSPSLSLKAILSRLMVTKLVQSGRAEIKPSR
jgi:hypothetical protein